MEFLAIYGDFMEMGFLWIGIAIVALIIKSFTKEYITLCIAAAALITAFMAFKNRPPGGHVLRQHHRPRSLHPAICHAQK